MIAGVAIIALLILVVGGGLWVQRHNKAASALDGDPGCFRRNKLPGGRPG